MSGCREREGGRVSARAWYCCYSTVLSNLLLTEYGSYSVISKRKAMAEWLALVPVVNHWDLLFPPRRIGISRVNVMVSWN